MRNKSIEEMKFILGKIRDYYEKNLEKCGDFERSVHKEIVGIIGRPHCPVDEYVKGVRIESKVDFCKIIASEDPYFKNGILIRRSSPHWDKWTSDIFLFHEIYSAIETTKKCNI